MLHRTDPSIEPVEAQIHRIEAPVHLIEARVKACFHLVDSFVHSIEALVHRIETLIDRVKAAVHLVPEDFEPAIDSLFGVLESKFDGRLQLDYGCHDLGESQAWASL